MTAACPVIDAQSGVIRGVLFAVDCHTRRFAQSGYDTLADPASPFQGWLTALLVIYVAVLGYRMLFGVGRARISDLPMTALLIGAVLALTANWSLFQILVFDLASRAPIEIARLTTAPLHAQGSSLAANPVGALQFAYDELTRAAALLGNTAAPAGGPGIAAPPGASTDGGNAVAAAALWRASQALFLSTAGLFCAAIVAVGALTAVGPIFIALSLLRATRGLFVGWLRALLVAALAPMAGWMATSLMLAVIEPNLLALADQRASGRLDVDTAMTTASVVLVFATVQVALLAAGALIALGLRLPATGRSRPEAGTPAAGHAEVAGAVQAISRPEALARTLRRSEATGAARGRAAAASLGAGDFGDRSAPAAALALGRGSDGAAGSWERYAPPPRRPAIVSRDAFPERGAFSERGAR